MSDSTSSSVYIFIFNQAGEFLLQLRAADDESYPLHYDVSAAGGIESGEDKDVAAMRELKEELGIETDLTYIGDDQYEGQKMFLYKGLASSGFNIGKEVDSIQFASLDKVREMIENKDKFHPEFIYLFRKYFE